MSETPKCSLVTNSENHLFSNTLKDVKNDLLKQKLESSNILLTEAEEDFKCKLRNKVNYAKDEIEIRVESLKSELDKWRDSMHDDLDMHEKELLKLYVRCDDGEPSNKRLKIEIEQNQDFKQKFTKLQEEIDQNLKRIQELKDLKYDIRLDFEFNFEDESPIGKLSYDLNQILEESSWNFKCSDFNVDKMKIIHEFTSLKQGKVLHYVGKDVLALENNDRTIDLWNISSCQFIRTIEGEFLCLVPDIKLAISPQNADFEPIIEIWNMEDLSKQVFESYAYILTMLTSKTGAVIELKDTADDVKNILFYSFESNPPTLLHKIENAHSIAIVMLRALPNEGLASSSDDGLIKIWNSERQLVHTLRGETEKIIEIKVFSSELLISSWDSSTRVWNLKTGECLRIIKSNGEFLTIKDIVPNKYFIMHCEEKDKNRGSLSFYSMKYSKPCNNITLDKLGVPKSAIYFDFIMLDEQRCVFSFKDKVKVVLFENF